MKKKILLFTISFLLLSSKISAQLLGVSQPYQEVSISSAEGGIITAILVQEGSEVKKGQAIARLETSVLEASLQVALAEASHRGELQAAVAEKKFSQRRLEQIRELARGNSVRPEEVEKAQLEYQLAEAKLRSAKERLRIKRLEVNLIKTRLRRHFIKSPIAGVVREVITQVGESISINRPLLKLAQLGRLKIDVRVPFAQVQTLTRTSTASIFFPATKQQGKAKVIFIDPVIDTASDTTRVLLELNNPDHQYPVGSPCEVEFQQEGKKG